MNDKRLQALEELAAHQAKTIDDLSAELAVHGALLRRVQKKIDAMAERFLALEDTVAPDADDRLPPHW